MADTRADMKTEMTSLLKRGDLTSRYENAIKHAIEELRDDEVYWRDVRDKTFTTVIDQVWYSSTDDADIGLFSSIEDVQIRVSNHDYSIDKRTSIAEFERLIDGNVSSGQPYAYIWRNREIGLYPPPDTAWTVTVYGKYDLAIPATDGETSNLWMTTGRGYYPVMHKALAFMQAFHIRNDNMAAKHEMESQRFMRQLKSRSARLGGSGWITPTRW
tara:strand:- start:7363 stop:8007 length:645 start_codon:yes stop_codon:yes gene_type:complete